MKLVNCKIVKSIIIISTIFCLLIITGWSSKLNCQESAKYSDTILAIKSFNEPYIWEIGVFGGILLNSHFVDFHALPNVPSCCPEYKTGFGVNFTLGALFDYKIHDEYNLFAQIRAAYSNIGGTIKAEEKQLMFYTPTQSVMGLIEHTIETSISSLSLQPIIKYGIAKNTYLHLGFSFAYLSFSSFEQKETLVEPKDMTFENGSKIRMNYGGSIPGVTNLYSSIVGGVNYDFAITSNQDWFLSPELFLDYGLNNIIPEEKWNILSYKLALAVNYRQGIEEIEKFEQQENIDTIKIEMPVMAESRFILGQPKISYDSLRVKNVLTITENYFRTDTLYYPPEYIMTASLKISGLDDKGNEIESPDIKLEEFLFNKMQPILNFVFFDSNSYTLPVRYSLITESEVNDFTLNKSFTKEELGFYHNILNIIGYKMIQNADANITLIGCNNNLDAEKNNLTLSRNRAESIKTYLTDVWKIPENRIIVKARNLPATASNNKVTEGHEENRRVEIFSDNFRITSSLIARDTLIEVSFVDKEDVQLRKLNFGGFRIRTTVSSGKEIKDWNLAVIQEGDTLQSFTGQGSIPQTHDWLLNSVQSASEILSKPINIFLTASDVNGKNVNLTEIPKVDVKTIASKRQNKEKDIKKDSYSMMLFEFASARFTEENKDFPKIVRRLLKDDSKVQVIGYSDSFGNDDYNLRLSTQRAQAVAKALDHPNVIARGVGETILLYSNDTPEGRFYCRTVDIISETPMHW